MGSQVQTLNNGNHLNPRTSHVVTSLVLTKEPLNVSLSPETVNSNESVALSLPLYQPLSHSHSLPLKSQSQAGKQHLMTGLSHTKRRKMKPMVIVNSGHSARLRKLLPYAGRRAGFRRVNQQDSVWWRLGRLQKTGLALQEAIKRAESARRSQILSSS